MKVHSRSERVGDGVAHFPSTATSIASISIIASSMLRRSAWRPIDYLFRRFAVEVFVVGLRVGAGMVDNAVPMIRWRIERIKLQGCIAGIDDVVIGASRDDYRKARPDRRPNAIENRLTAPLLHTKELVKLVDLRPDLLLGLSRSPPWALKP